MILCPSGKVRPIFMYDKKYLDKRAKYIYIKLTNAKEITD